MKTTSEIIRRLVGRYAKDERGVMAILSVLFVVMLVGIGGLVIDLGRVYNLHSQMYGFVDNAALAAAAELDGNTGSLDRAKDAALDLIKGVGSSGSGSGFGAQDFTVESVYFLSSLTMDPADPKADQRSIAGDVHLCRYEGGSFSSPCDTPEGLAAAEADAQFVVVTVAPQTVTYYVLPIVDLIGNMFGAAPIVGSQTTQLQATAGFKREVCNNVPLMICNPAETAEVGAAFTPKAGQGISAKTVGGTGAWGPGNFGLLCDNANDCREKMARKNPNFMCVSGQVDTKPGQATGPVEQGLNVRFDVYSGPMNSEKNNPEYAPAPNIAKGAINKPSAKKCPDVTQNKDKSTDTMPLPRDNCFSASGAGCTYYNGEKRYGDGNWDRAGYWAENHPGIGQPAGYIDASSPIGGMTRYETYRYEIEHPQQVNEPSETGVPQCSASPTDADRDNDRRVLIVAVVNCREHTVQGNMNDVPVEGFAKVFLTEPAGHTNWGAAPQDIWIEMIGKVDPGAPDGVLHEYPVLYR